MYRDTQCTHYVITLLRYYVIQTTERGGLGIRIYIVTDITSYIIHVNRSIIKQTKEIKGWTRQLGKRAQYQYKAG